MEDMDNILNKIEQIKKELDNLYSNLEEIKVSGKEKNGLVKTIVNGKGEIIDFEFENGLVDKEFKDAIIESINNGLEKSRELKKEKKQKIIGEVDIPDIPGIFDN
ncbi:MAG: YbaB/EbfC family nucleoid-associated protein [Bacillota bacterium]